MKKDIVEAVTILETPPVRAVGMVGYVETPRGLRTLTSVWAQNLTTECKRRFYKNWWKAKKKAFSKYAKRYQEPEDSKRHVKRDIERIKKYATSVRLIVHTQVNILKLRQRKAHIMEIQVNGGSISDKVDFCRSKFEQLIPVGDVFQTGEQIDIVGVTRGHGFQGVVKRFGVARLQRKTHRGLRKIACIGAWHPASVQWTVGRAGQHGYHHRTEMNKKIYLMGSGEVNGVKNNARTENDIEDKNITPLGGFPFYGEVKQDFLMLKGCTIGPKKRVLTLRKSLNPKTTKDALEPVQLKFIDTASKIGHGRFQTLQEKEKFFGPLKKK